MFSNDELFIIGEGIIALMDNVRKSRAAITWNTKANEGMAEAEQELRVLLNKVVQLQMEMEQKEMEELAERARKLD